MEATRRRLEQRIDQALGDARAGLAPINRRDVLLIVANVMVSVGT
jgi:hypothetical protein